METQKIEMYVGRYDGDARTWYETAVEIPADTLPEEVEGAALQALASRLEGSDGPVAFYGVMPVWTTAGKEVSCV